MKNSEIVQTLMFDYADMTTEAIAEQARLLPRKLIRWLGENHPDNRTRKIFFAITNVEIGEGTVLNAHLVISDGYQPLLKIGNRVAFSPNVTVICQSGPNNSQLQHHAYVKEKLLCDLPVIIEDDVWIGAQVVILPGVTVGRSAIVGAGSVVSRDVPPYTIVAGVPARVIRQLTVPPNNRLPE